MEAAGSKSPSGLSKNVESVVLALEKRGVVITESSVEFTGKKTRPKHPKIPFTPSF
jgi:hypothetical protein